MHKPTRRLGFLLLAVLLVVLAVPAFGAGASARQTGPPGHKTLLARSAPPTTVKMGRFIHPKPPKFDHDQFASAKLPIGKFHARRHSVSTHITVGVVDGAGHPRLPLGDPAPTVNLNTSHVAPYDGWIPEEPTTAAVGNTVVYTSNDLLSLSVDGGHTFHSFDPRSMYRDSPAGGPDGDQDVIYVPQINSFVWLVQYFPGATGANLDRLAVFPPSAVTASGLTSWTYWDISSSSLPGTDIFFDFPDLAFGNSYLYLTQNPSHGGHPTQTFIARIGLYNLQHGLNLASAPEPWRYIIGGLFFGKVVQNTGSIAYWASNSSTSTMAASDWPESSTSWFGPTNVNVASWPNANYSSTTPDGRTWLEFVHRCRRGLRPRRQRPVLRLDGGSWEWTALVAVATPRGAGRDDHLVRVRETTCDLEPATRLCLAVPHLGPQSPGCSSARYFRRLGWKHLLREFGSGRPVDVTKPAGSDCHQQRELRLRTLGRLPRRAAVLRCGRNRAGRPVRRHGSRVCTAGDVVQQWLRRPLRELQRMSRIRGE